MSAVLPVRVTPRSARPGIGGWRAGADGRKELEVRVAEAPTDGAANEAVVKLLAFLVVGSWVYLSLSGTSTEMLRSAPVSLLNPEQSFGTRWFALCFLAGAAVICLPRQYQVTVVENSGEAQLRTASWLFPLYLFLMNLFVLPIAMAGLNHLPDGSDRHGPAGSRRVLRRGSA